MNGKYLQSLSLLLFKEVGSRGRANNLLSRWVKIFGKCALKVELLSRGKKKDSKEQGGSPMGQDHKEGVCSGVKGALEKEVCCKKVLGCGE